MTSVGAITHRGMSEIRAHVLERFAAELRADPSQVNDAVRSLREFGVLESDVHALRWVASLGLPPPIGN